MFDFFKKKTFEDEFFGELVRSCGRWKGSINLPGTGKVELRVSGNGKMPYPANLEVARELVSRFRELESQIRKALFEHFEPYKTAYLAGGIEDGDEEFPQNMGIDDVFDHTKVDAVVIGQMEGAPTQDPVIEIAYITAWDHEHLLGARIQNLQLFELCGSI